MWENELIFHLVLITPPRAADSPSHLADVQNHLMIKTFHSSKVKSQIACLFSTDFWKLNQSKTSLIFDEITGIFSLF